MTSLAEAQLRANESLRGFPPEIVAAYLAFAEHGDPADLDIVVLGVLRFYLAKKPAASLSELPGSTRLVEDLGCDSLTMMDTVFMVETLLNVKLDDAQLPGLQTLNDLSNYLRKLVGQPVAR